MKLSVVVSQTQAGRLAPRVHAWRRPQQEVPEPASQRGREHSLALRKRTKQNFRDMSTASGREEKKEPEQQQTENGVQVFCCDLGEELPVVQQRCLRYTHKNFKNHGFGWKTCF
jgi:hypothetical protein